MVLHNDNRLYKKDITQHSKNYKKEYFNNKIRNILNQTNTNSIILELNDILNNKLQSYERFLKKNQSKPKNEQIKIQRNIFREIIIFLNSLYYTFGIRRIYSTLPKMKIKEYKQLSISEQFIHNVYNDKWDWLLNSNIEGGNCWFRTVLFFSFFENLKKVGFDGIKDIWIVMSKNIPNVDLGHSFLYIGFQSEKYLVDFKGFYTGNDKSKKVLVQNCNNLKYKGNNLKNLRKEGGYEIFKSINPFIDKISEITQHQGSFSIKMEDEYGRIEDINFIFSNKQIEIESTKSLRTAMFHISPDMINNIDNIPDELLFDKLFDNNFLETKNISKDMVYKKLSSSLSALTKKIDFSKLRKIIKGENPKFL